MPRDASVSGSYVRSLQFVKFEICMGCPGAPLLHKYFTPRVCQMRVETNRLMILLKSTKISLYSPFSEWFGTKQNSVWFPINQKMDNTNWFGVDLRRIRCWFLCVYQNRTYNFLSIHAFLSARKLFTIYLEIKKKLCTRIDYREISWHTLTIEKFSWNAELYEILSHIMTIIRYLMIFTYSKKLEIIKYYMIWKIFFHFQSVRKKNYCWMNSLKFQFFFS